MRRFAVFLALISVFMFAAAVTAFSADDRLDRLEGEVKSIKQENEALKKRLEEVEADQEDTKQNYSNLSKLVDVSGYADAQYSITSQPGENNHFRIKHLSLFFSKEVQKEWKLFSEIEYEDAPLIDSNKKTDTVSKSQGTVFLEQMYVQYRPAVDMNLRLGRYLTPFGIWSIYHYPPYVPTQTNPMFFKVMFPEVSDGVQIGKSFSVRKSLLDATLYIGNGAGNPGGTDRNENKGVGARVNYGTDMVSGLEVGASFYREKDNFGTMQNVYGGHMQYTRSRFQLQSEYVLRRNHPANSGWFNDAGFYALANYDIGKWAVAGRFDWFNSNQKVARNGHYRYTGALNYHIAHNVIAKMEYDRNVFADPNTRNYSELILAIAVAIGDL